MKTNKKRKLDLYSKTKQYVSFFLAYKQEVLAFEGNWIIGLDKSEDNNNNNRRLRH